MTESQTAGFATGNSRSQSDTSCRILKQHSRASGLLSSHRKLGSLRRHRHGIQESVFWIKEVREVLTEVVEVAGIGGLDTERPEMSVWRYQRLRFFATPES